MANLAALLEKSVENYADRTAIVFGDTRLTYAQVNEAANQVANLLVERGIKPGDKVALSSPNVPHFTVRDGRSFTASVNWATGAFRRKAMNSPSAISMAASTSSQSSMWR